MVLYRGTGLTLREIKQFVNKIGYKIPDGSYWNFTWKQMSLFGFISTTEDKSTGYDFAWENPEESKVRVVFEIFF